MMVWALSIAALMAGSFRSGQFELFTGTMFFPLKVGSRIVCGSWKSGSHPTFGQMFGSFFGTLQNFVYMVACVTETVFTLKPILARSAATTWAVFDPGGVLSATCWIAGPLYIPFEYPACFIIAFALATSPEKPALGNGLKVSPP